MGLLDYGFEDPNTAGLLSLGLRLMSTPGKFGTALGSAGLGAMGDMQRARAQQQDRQQAAQRQQLFEMQMKQAQQAQADAELARANEARFRGMIPDPSAQAAQAALAGGGGPTLANAQQIRSVDPQQQMLYNAMSTGQIRPMEYLSAIQKDRTPIKLGKDDRLLEPGTNRVLVDSMPDPAKGSPIAQLMGEMNALPPGDPRRAIYQNAINKATTHQPGTNVTYGAPVAGVDANGNPVFFQPGRDGGPPAIVPNVKPPLPKLGERQQNQVVGIDAMGQAVDAYVEALGKWNKRDALNPDRRAEIGTYYNNMMLQAKEAYNLGVLNGPDLQILENVVRNPLTMTGMVTSNEAMAKQATDLKRIMNKIKAGITQKPGSAAEPGAPAAPKFLGYEPL